MKIIAAQRILKANDQLAAIDRFAADVRRLAPSSRIFQAAALQNEGLEPLAQWLIERCRT